MIPSPPAATVRSQPIAAAPRAGAKQDRRAREGEARARQVAQLKQGVKVPLASIDTDGDLGRSRDEADVGGGHLPDVLVRNIGAATESGLPRSYLAPLLRGVVLVGKTALGHCFKLKRAEMGERRGGDTSAGEQTNRQNFAELDPAPRRPTKTAASGKPYRKPE